MPRRRWIFPYQADGWLIAGVLHPIIDGVQVEIHLVGVLGPELANLQINHNETAQVQVIEQQVDVGRFLTFWMRMML